MDRTVSLTIINGLVAFLASRSPTIALIMALTNLLAGWLLP